MNNDNPLTKTKKKRNKEKEDRLLRRLQTYSLILLPLEEDQVGRRLLILWSFIKNFYSRRVNRFPIYYLLRISDRTRPPCRSATVII